MPNFSRDVVGHVHDANDKRCVGHENTERVAVKTKDKLEINQNSCLDFHDDDENFENVK